MAQTGSASARQACRQRAAAREQPAAGLPPWGPPAANFVTFPLPAAGPLVTLQTSEGGAGAMHIDFAAATILDGTQFDVMFRLVDSLTTPTNELRTGCFTVTVK